MAIGLEMQNSISGLIFGVVETDVFQVAPSVYL